MAALSADRNTPYKQGDLIALPMATNTTIYAGALVVLSSGYATNGSAAASLITVGMADEKKVNSGANGAATVRVRRNGLFKFANSGTDAVVAADLGGTCYIEDNQTVCHTSTNKSAAGQVLGIESDGVWVKI